MLKQRLFFGALMTVFFTGVMVFDGWLDGSLTSSPADDRTVQSTGCLPAGTIFFILVAVLIILGEQELSQLAAAKNLRIFRPISIIASILFASVWYWQQVIEIPTLIYLFFLSAFSLFGLLLYQYFVYGSSGVIANCGVNYFSIIYLGLLSGFVLGIRVEFGLWPLLMFVLVVKTADIGAYAIGRPFGKHKFSPKISPSKTWEGMAGAVATAMIVAFLFSRSCGIMSWWLSVIFGFCFAFIGQIGDLVESMMKRDAEQKDSANNVPGFGGILDIVDSPLVAAPFAYLFFMFGIAG